MRWRNHQARTTFGAAPLDNRTKAASLSPITRSPAAPSTPSLYGLNTYFFDQADQSRT
jgi:hypothetical protein